MDNAKKRRCSTRLEDLDRIQRGQDRPPLDYVHLAHYAQPAIARCSKPEHEHAVKRAIWDLTLGLAQLRGEEEEESSFLVQALQNMSLKMSIWRSMGLDLEVKLFVDIVSREQNGSNRGLASMLEGKRGWSTNMIANMLNGTVALRAGEEESFIVGVASGSQISRFELASLSHPYTGRQDATPVVSEMRMDSLNMDGSVDEEIVPWDTYGTCTSPLHLNTYTPAEILAVTPATRFKVYVRHTGVRADERSCDQSEVFGVAGVAIFRAFGVAALPPLALAAPTSAAATVLNADAVDLTCDPVEGATAYLWSKVGDSTWSKTTSEPFCRDFVGEIGSHAFVVSALYTHFGWKDPTRSKASTPTATVDIAEVSTPLYAEMMIPATTSHDEYHSADATHMLKGHPNHSWVGYSPKYPDQLNWDVQHCRSQSHSTPAFEEISVVLGFACGTNLTGFLVTARRNPGIQFRVESLNADGSVREEILPWNHTGGRTFTDSGDPQWEYNYAICDPFSIMVKTMTRRVKISSRSVLTLADNAPLYGFRPIGVAAPSPSPPAVPTSVIAELIEADMVRLSCDSVVGATSYSWDVSSSVHGPVRCWTSSEPLCLVLIGAIGSHTFVVRAQQKHFGWKAVVESLSSTPTAAVNVLDVRGGQLNVNAVTPGSDERSSLSYITSLLNGSEVWDTTGTPHNQEESIVVSVAPDSRVVFFDIATLQNDADANDYAAVNFYKTVRVDALNVDGTVGEEIVPWNNYGTCVKDDFEVWLDPSHYTPATIMVNTTATSFKITVRQCVPQGEYEWEESREPCDAIAGLGIFRAYGLPPP